MKWFKLIARKFGTAVTLSWHDRWLVVEAWILLLLVDLSLLLLPFRWVQKLVELGRRNSVLPPAGGSSGIARHLHSLVKVSVRNHVYPMGCLQQSLVLQWLLGRRGIVAALRIGVRKESDGLHAHAWLEQAGAAIAEREQIIASYAPLVAREADR